jgi:AGCS family alanine or glycine:cation symporter
VESIIGQLNGIVWGPFMLAFLAGTGVFLTIGLRFMPILRLGYGFRQLFTPLPGGREGDISPFRALMTSLSATVGSGNIAGVATAIALGGPGALFWMWMIALFGMATKYAEAVLAVKFRETDHRGNHVGGPMYYIKNGLGKKWIWLAGSFAFFGMFAGFGIGNAVQSNTVAHAMESAFNIEPWITGVVFALMAGAVILGGIQRIAHVASLVVPFMAIGYVTVGLYVIGINADKLGESFQLVFYHAFNPVAAAGGAVGATVWMAIRFGVARGIFSNEAGLGSAPIAHAAAKTDNPVRQGVIAMLGVFIDTLVICSITGLAIITSGAWKVLDINGHGLQGAELTQAAFTTAFPVGAEFVSVALIFFAFTSILGWSYYGERCTQFLFGERSVVPFRVLWVLMVPVGALNVDSLAIVWLLADTLNALMAIPNLIALLLLSPLVFRLTRDYFDSKKLSVDPLPATGR